MLYVVPAVREETVVDEDVVAADVESTVELSELIT
jgi:hypothetical protein